MITLSQPSLDVLLPRMTAYIPHKPTPKQRAFLLLPHREAFFGGAAGGGKSDALLMAALQYVDIPGYNAIIFRKTMADAAQPQSILFRARQWLTGTDARFDSIQNRYFFPSGATLSFGGLKNVGDAYKYQGPEYQFIGFDEFTQFYMSDCEFVMTRLRRQKCPFHNKVFNDSCKSCHQYHLLSKVPLRIRTASNPGGFSHIQVKKRYDIGLIPGKKTPNGKPLYAGRNLKRPHIPSWMYDNPFLDQEEYKEIFLGMEDHVTREQLESGDWGISEDGRFKMSWCQRYDQLGTLFKLGPHQYSESDFHHFMMIDCAASKDSTPGRTSLTKKLASHTALMFCSVTPRRDLIIREVERHQKEAPDAVDAIRGMMRRYPQVQFVGMEYTTMSTHLFQLLQTAGLPMRGFSPNTGDKIQRSVDAQNRMKQGKIWFPSAPSRWSEDLDGEIFTWTGHPHQTDDQVDCLAYSAIYMTEESSGIGEMSASSLPSVV